MSGLATLNPGQMVAATWSKSPNILRILSLLGCMSIVDTSHHNCDPFDGVVGHLADVRSDVC